MKRAETKLLRQLISREQRRVGRRQAMGGPVTVLEDRRPRPLCAVCDTTHPPEDFCPPEEWR